jgi:hypothetical protein
LLNLSKVEECTISFEVNAREIFVQVLKPNCCEERI